MASRQNIGNDGDWLRMVIPMNLRRADARSLSAANMVGNAFGSCRGRDRADPARLLRSIHKEMALVKRWHLGWPSILLGERLSVASRKIGEEHSGRPVYLVLHAHQCRQTVWPPAAQRPPGTLGGGNVTLENIGFIPPTSPYSCVSVCLTMFAEAGFRMHYDRGLCRQDRRQTC